MLLLKQYTDTIDGITFFADDEDDTQYWYLPQTISLAERKKQAIFTLIKYTGDGADSQGGYVNFEVNMHLDDMDIESAFRQYLNNLNRDREGAKKAPVPYDSGTVNFNVLDTASGKGQLVSVKSPSLIGDNTAVFSAKLTKEQVAILEKLFQDGAAPASVAYSLDYTGMIPALEVDVQAKFENVYSRFSGEFGAGGIIPIQTPFQFMARFNTVIEKLKTNNELKITIKNKIPGVDTAEQEKWVMDFVKQEILNSFFKATLKPNAEDNAQADTPSSSILNSILRAGQKAIEGGGKTGGTDGGKTDGKTGGKTGAASGALGALLPIPSVSIDLSFVHKTEVKTLDFNFISSRAMKQTVFPQNVIDSKLVKGVSKGKPYYLEVNTNDPFYQQINYAIAGPDDGTFTDFGLRAAAFEMKYNGQSYTRDEGPFTEGNQNWKKQIARSSNTKDKFNISKQFVFKSTSETGVIGNSTDSFAINTRSVLEGLDPNDFLILQKVRLRASSRLKKAWDKYDEIDVTIKYDDGDGNSGSKDYVFAEDESATQFFNYRQEKNKDWTITYDITYYLTTGEVKQASGEIKYSAFMIQPVE